MRELKHEEFERIKEKFWVLSFTNEKPSFNHWIFSPNGEPKQVPNQSMRWRKPTYVETLERQEAYEHYQKEHEEAKVELAKCIKQGKPVNGWLKETAEESLWFKRHRENSMRKYETVISR